MSTVTPTPTTPTTAKPLKYIKPEKPAPSEAGSGIGTNLLLSVLLGLFAMMCVIGLFAIKSYVGNLFGILYYFIFPVVLYLAAVGLNALSQKSFCNSVSNVTACFTGAAYTVGYLYVAMVAVNLVGPNGIWTFESTPLSAKEAPALVSNDSITTSNGKVNFPSSPIVEGARSERAGTASPTVPIKNLESPLILTKQTGPSIASASPPLQSSAPGGPQEERPLRLEGGGHRQEGGVKQPPMSDAALMIRSFFTTLRAPAMSLFIRDPFVATLEDVEKKSPVYTGIGIGYWAFLATVSGQVIGSAISQTC